MPLELTQEPPYYQIVSGPTPEGTLYYIALINQTGTDNPVLTQLLNTLGVTFTTSRTAPGVYTLQATNAIFPLAKTTLSITPSNPGFMIIGNNESGEPSNEIFIQTRDTTNTPADVLLYYATITITVFP